MPPTGNPVHTSGPQQGLQFRFGIVSDVQYADIKDGHSFLGTPRYYRASLDGLRRAVLGWKNQQVEFGIQFGDLIDGFNPKDKSETALQSVLDEFALLYKPVYHMIGNHCLYNLPRNRLNEALGIHGTSSYYSFSPHRGWRFVVIDAYDVSMLGWPESHPLHQQAKAILDEKNINENKNNPEGHEGPARRFVQFGGGISAEQLDWFVQQLADATAAHQRVIVCGHLPLHPGTCIGTCLLWNYEEVLQAIWDAGNVVATISGHTHNDGYAVDEHGVHHRVLNAVLETEPGKDCYGWLDVYADHLDLVGIGELDSQKMPFADQYDPRSPPKEQSHSVETSEAEEAALERQP
ncbi:hypothetical protein WJX77_000504 [Trebouxia sp. C0004]